MFTRPRRTTRGAAAATIAALLASPLFAVSASAVEPLPEPIANPEIRGTEAPQSTDRFIVKFKDQAQASSKPRSNAYGVKAKELGITVKELKIIGTGATVVETSRELESSEADAFVASLEANSAIEYAEPDQMMQATSLTPIDPYWGYQWPIFDAKSGIGAKAAWDTTTGEGVTVAVIDTGITTHVDLDANVLPGYDMIGDPVKGRDGDGRDDDATDEGDYGASGECGTASSSWHGTHVAGTIAAVANDQGVVGIAPSAKILPIRALAECGGWMSDIIDGVTWASGGVVPGLPANPNQAQVINLSLGGSGGCSTSWQTAIDGAVSRGSVVVAAAGNESKDASSSNPANCANVISVAASGRDGGLAPYSNYGDVVDVVAPGGNMNIDAFGGILSTINMGSSGPIEDLAGQAYAFYQGTSMAAPHVSATAALMLSANRTLSPATVEAQLKATSKALPLPCAWGCGTGLINARAAVDAALTVEIPTPPEPGSMILPGPVAITGTPIVGGTLFANIGAWEPAPVDVALQWYRNGTIITGATGTSYTLTPEDVNQSMWVVATGTKPGFDDVTKESAHTHAVLPGKLTPVQPQIITLDEYVVGTTLWVRTGTWQPTPVAISYQWYRDTDVIPGATSATYKLSSADVGKSVRADVTGIKTGYTPLTRATTATSPVREAPITGTPTISGIARVGRTLTASPGTWSPVPESFTYRWYSDGQQLVTLDAATYTLRADDYGKKIRVTVTGTKSGSVPVTVTSAETSVVQLGELTGSVPVIEGSAAVGQTLTADAGAWAANAVLEYRWLRDGIPLEGKAGRTYSIVLEDVGHAISVEVIGRQTGYADLAKTSAATEPVETGMLTAPTPSVAGTTSVGSTLTATTGEWTSGTDFKYQWYRTGVPITGATGATYTLTADDLGKTISVGVTGSKNGYADITKVSPQTESVTAGSLTAPVPTVGGTATVGSTLAATTGEWTTGTTFTYQWFRSGVPITGATEATYVLAAEDLGKTISVGVTGSKTGYLEATKVSSHTESVTAGSLTASVPIVGGTVKVGYTLTANTGSWTTGTTFKYQWFRTGVPITGATSATYALTAADLGKNISIGVTGSKAGYTNVTSYSVRTGAVVAGSLAAAKPTVTGTTKVGYTLTANTGAWTAGTTFKYQWFRTGVPITGATGAKYALTAADLGKNISVGVTGSKAGYTNVTAYSVRTAGVVAGTLTAAKPTVSGTTRLNYTLTANTGAWTAGTTFTYQWFRTGVPIKGATGKTYKLTSADLGKAISVGVTGRKAGYNSVLSYSLPTRAVTR